MEQLPEGHWESRLKTGWVAQLFVWTMTPGLTTLGQPERPRQEVLPATKDQIRIEPRWHAEVWQNDRNADLACMRIAQTLSASTPFSLSEFANLHS